jgi:hypothetical protein
MCKNRFPYFRPAVEDVAGGDDQRVLRLEAAVEHKPIEAEHNWQKDCKIK